MQDAETRLMWIIPLSLGLIFILLYSALRSWLDAVVVLSNVFAMAMGGVWALYLTGTNFSISAAVGFISLFGVAIMDGLLMISYFNTLRSQGEPLEQAIIEGAAKRVRPVMMTDADGLVRTVAGGPFHANRFADPAAAGHRRGRRHDHHDLAHPLSYAGAVQFLRPSRAAGGGRAVWHIDEGLGDRDSATAGLRNVEVPHGSRFAATCYSRIETPFPVPKP